MSALEVFFGYVQKFTLSLQPKTSTKEGNYYPVFNEVYQTDLEVQGTIPKDLEGAYIRNGPNAHFQNAGDDFIFDGDGMLHSTKIKDGKVTFNNKYVRTELFEAEEKYGYPLFIKVG